MVTHPSVPAVVFLHLVVAVSWANFAIHPLGDKVYIQEGDLFIGVLLTVTYYEPNRPCGDRLYGFYKIEVIETIVFAVRELNKRLPVKLGFVILDTCDKATTAALQSLRFLPLPNPLPSETPSQSSSFLESFTVIGVVGTDQSFSTIPAARILNVANIPMVSFWATDISLNDKSLYPNFHRVIWSDEELMEAIVQFLLSNHFYYFTIIFEDSLPATAIFERILAQKGGAETCHPTELQVRESDDFEGIVYQLLRGEYRSRVVVVLAHVTISVKLIHAIIQTQTESQLLWIGGDAWTQAMFNIGGPKGSIGVNFQWINVTSFPEYFRDLNSSNENPWFIAAVQEHFKCSLKGFDECFKENIQGHLFDSGLSLVFKAVNVYGEALMQMFNDHCKNDHSSVYKLACFNSNAETFPSYVEAANKEIKEEGWRFSVFQSSGSKSSVVHIQELDIVSNDSRSYHPINMTYFASMEEFLDPRNFCMPKCPFGEYRFYLSKCCWSCRKCQENEIVGAKRTDCKQCPLLQWPNQYKEGEGECDDIPPHHLDIRSLPILFLHVLCLLGFIAVVTTLAWYSRHRKHEALKASSIELSCVQLMAFACGYLTVPIMLSPPTTFTCTLGLLMLNISFSLVYVIVLFKAVRVYRIFKHSKKNIKISYTSPLFQVAACFAYVVIEVARFMIANRFLPVRIEVSQPYPEVRYVEVSCRIPGFRIFFFIFENFVLLLVCSYWAFKTKRLPSRFKESRYVSMCVGTTLLILSILAPAYFTQVRKQMRIVVLLAALVINVTASFFFLFVSRILTVEHARKGRKKTYARIHKLSKEVLSLKKKLSGNRSRQQLF
ncbi:metabotropic glutamate receptor 5-like [Biomphalaria glabrata]|uniref:Metabotropic glutamate receptor 5-like n=2 Tax=Biomphalaria glabrata TaxID=6526 RepID=A0A9W3AAB8_BIOGL|nr:metabotropic glutamate receptor 5-like [Biomphalaria glabrata]